MFYAHKCVSSGPLGPAIPEKTTNKETSKNEIKKSSNPVNRIEVINEFKPKNECGKHGDPVSKILIIININKQKSRG